LSPRELAVNFTDTNGSFVSEASVYRLLKDHGLITSPAFILMKAADRFANPTTAPNQLWQTDFTYLKVIGWAGPLGGCAKRSRCFLPISNAFSSLTGSDYEDRMVPAMSSSSQPPPKTSGSWRN
jgi:hypothetical protein